MYMYVYMYMYKYMYMGRRERDRRCVRVTLFSVQSSSPYTKQIPFKFMFACILNVHAVFYACTCISHVLPAFIGVYVYVWVD